MGLDMIICYLRSSSYGTYSMCEQQYFIRYGLGVPDQSNKSAVKGTVVHRALQVLADKKLAIQNNQSEFNDDDFGIMTVDECDDLDKITKLCWDLYTPKETHLNFTNSDFNDCKKWLKKAVDYMDGAFDPRNQKIIEAEKFFDLEIVEPWAYYEYELNGETISGHLSLKGTVDLIIEHDEDTIEVIDYKTGKRLNWATGDEYDLNGLHYNHQLLMYFYALKKEYPDKNIIISIYYINDGGVFSLCFDDSDIERAKEVIKKRFLEIKKNKKPKMLSRDLKHWKCQKLCHFGKTNMPGTKKKICEFFRDELTDKGMDTIEKEYIDITDLTHYGSGGGRTHDKESKDG